MTSGCIPLSEKGMSTAGHFCEQTPFWPCREENLSPITGDRVMRSVMCNFCSSESPASLPKRHGQLRALRLEERPYLRDVLHQHTPVRRLCT